MHNIVYYIPPMHICKYLTYKAVHKAVHAYTRLCTYQRLAVIGSWYVLWNIRSLVGLTLMDAYTKKKT